MFRGINSVNLDSKGRFALPRRYQTCIKDEADGKVIITIDPDECCLLLYPLQAWEDIACKIESLPSFNPLTRRIQRSLIGHATEEDLDNSGRILIPPLLRDYASLQLQGKIILLGQGKKFEIWSHELWEKERETWRGRKLLTNEELPEGLKSLAL